MLNFEVRKKLKQQQENSFDLSSQSTNNSNNKSKKGIFSINSTSTSSSSSSNHEVMWYEKYQPKNTSDLVLHYSKVSFSLLLNFFPSFFLFFNSLSF